MEGNKKKELIEEIVGQLRTHELPYKEGAWEKFASNYGAESPPSSAWKYWSAAAAVLLCFGVGYWGLKHNSAVVSPSPTVLTTVPENKEILSDSRDLKESLKRSLSEATKELGLGAPELMSHRPYTYSKIHEGRIAPSGRQQLSLFGGNGYEGLPVVGKDNLAAVSRPQSMQQKTTTPLASIHIEDNHVAESVTAVADPRTVEQLRSNGTSSFSQTQREAARLSELYAMQQGRSSVVVQQDHGNKKWEMGAFVSPASTSKSITLGGGVALAYNVSTKVSIRSGASIQHYGAVSGNSPITPALASNSFVADAPNYISQTGLNNSLVMRTADAKEAKSNERVSGKILTVDIPVDVRYSINKNFYTSVGVSYVGILDQERATIYETNNTEYRQKSTEKNVDDQGVNGFINLSVGRKQRVGKLSISVEPYYKIPVGGLRSSDLNYTNGGVKIITSF